MLMNPLKSLRSVVLLFGAAGGLLTAGASLAADASADFAGNNWVEVDGVWYPYCTNSADNGGGFGWQPELGGPNGGSCKINYSNGGGGGNGGYSNPGYPSGTWYDGNGTAYPYCTNSADNGGGFGWQPELGGPNGGSCKINYGNGGGGGNGGWHDDRGGWHDGRRGGPVDVRVGRGGVGVRVGPVGVRVGGGGVGVRIGRRLTEGAATIEE